MFHYRPPLPLPLSPGRMGWNSLESVRTSWKRLESLGIYRPQVLEMDWTVLACLMQTPLVLDCRYALDPSHLARAGFRYATTLPSTSASESSAGQICCIDQ